VKNQEVHFFQNYDTYGPYAGLLHDMKKYKSVKDFFKNNRSKHRRRMLLSMAIENMIKLGYDFPTDYYSQPFAYDSGYNNQVGILDSYLSNRDTDDKEPQELNFRNDLVQDKEIPTGETGFINPAEPPTFGLQDGIYPVSDKDQLENKNNNNYFGTTNLGRDTYKSILF